MVIPYVLEDALQTQSYRPVSSEDASRAVPPSAQETIDHLASVLGGDKDHAGRIYDVASRWMAEEANRDAFVTAKENASSVGR